MMAATDSRHFAPFADATFRFAPLAMNRQQRDSIHGVNENVAVDSIERGEVFYRHLITSHH
jgi:carboxypeptidase PM20D1